MLQLALLPIKAAKHTLVYKNDQVTFYLPEFQDQKSLTPHWRSFLGDSSDVAASIFTYWCSQYNQYPSKRSTNWLLSWQTRPKIVDALLMLNSELHMESVAFSFVCNSSQYNDYRQQRLIHCSITWLTGPKIIDALLTLIFRMEQRAYHFLKCFEIWPIPHLWSSASNRQLDYPWCKTKNHWRTVPYYVRDGGESMLLLPLHI